MSYLLVDVWDALLSLHLVMDELLLVVAKIECSELNSLYIQSSFGFFVAWECSKGIRDYASITSCRASNFKSNVVHRGRI